MIKMEHVENKTLTANGQSARNLDIHQTVENHSKPSRGG
jgi:hypothetical protein